MCVIIRLSGDSTLASSSERTRQLMINYPFVTTSTWSLTGWLFSPLKFSGLETSIVGSLAHGGSSVHSVLFDGEKVDGIRLCDVLAVSDVQGAHQ